MTAQFRTAAALILPFVAAGSIIAAESPQRAFASDWQGRTVVIRQRLYSLVFNERGTMGHIYSGRREGLVVVTPQDGVFFEFPGRQHRDDVVLRDPGGMIEAVDRQYVADALDLRDYRKLEPLSLVQYDAGGELIVARAEVLKDSVRLTFSQPNGPNGDDPVSSLTVRWPLPLSKSFTERAQIEQLLSRYVERR
jgi:hypothetical protein